MLCMALPGTPGQRISDLCNGNHITQKQLAKKIGVSASQLSRIVSGETKTVSSDILIGVAKEFIVKKLKDIKRTIHIFQSQQFIGILKHLMSLLIIEMGI